MTEIESRFNLPGRAIQTTLVLAAIILSIPSSAHEQEDQELGSDVEEYMSYHLGRWQSRTTFFDAEGKVAREVVEGYGEKVLVSGQVNLHFSYNADETVNTAFRFYSPEDDKLYMIDVTAQGRWWIVSGKRGTDVQYSREKELPDGRKVILKITHSNIRPGAFDAVAEASFDGGESWRKTSLSRYRKIGDNPER